MKKTCFLIFVLVIYAFHGSNVQSQNLNRQVFREMERKNPRKMIKVPEIEGYLTLKGDFHMHTVFSDGSVWPETRVDEAWSDGLDVIAITDHDRYHPNKDYLSTDNTISFQIAGECAREKNILLIRAFEITRKMPPGHFNAWFVTDGNLPELNDTSMQAFLSVIEKLTGQGAFITWNHPGWAAQQKDTVKWFEIHQTLLNKGWLHGIEVFNEYEWYPVALQWAKTKNLAPFANTDIHDAIPATYGISPDFIRPMTLVFAKERTLESIREAMFARRTVAWFNGHLAGSEKILGELFDKSVKIKKISSANGKIKYQVSNPTDFIFNMKGLSKDWSNRVDIPGRSEVIITVPDKLNTIGVEITNWHTGATENLKKEIVLNQ
jgi:hypothetical protein